MMSERDRQHLNQLGGIDQLLETLDKRAVVGQSNGAAHAPARPPQLARSLKDLLANPELLREPRQLIPHLVVENATTLIAAREKIGKTTLVSQGVGAYLNRTVFLGETPVVVGPGVVLWYTIDEPLGDTVKRFAQSVHNSHDLFINDKPRTIGDLLAAIRADLGARPECRIVVVDTISRALQQSGMDINDTSKVGAAIRALVEIFREFEVAGVLIYHTNKGGKDYAGAVSIGATVDEVLILRRPGSATGAADNDEEDDDAPRSEDGRRWLVCEGRRLRGRYALAFDLEEDVYRIADTDAVHRKDSILRAACGAGAPFRKTELASLVRGKKQQKLLDIDDLRAKGFLDSKGGLYSITIAGRERLGRVGARTSMWQSEPNHAPRASVPAAGSSPAREPSQVPTVPASSQSGEPPGTASGTSPVPASSPRDLARELEQTGLTAEDRIECLAALGVDLYRGVDGELRARGPKEALDVARPSIVKHRDALTSFLAAQQD